MSLFRRSKLPDELTSIGLLTLLDGAYEMGKIDGHTEALLEQELSVPDVSGYSATSGSYHCWCVGDESYCGCPVNEAPYDYASDNLSGETAGPNPYTFENREGTVGLTLEEKVRDLSREMGNIQNGLLFIAEQIDEDLFGIAGDLSKIVEELQMQGAALAAHGFMSTLPIN